jgi:hypothetical protein
MHTGLIIKYQPPHVKLFIVVLRVLCKFFYNKTNAHRCCALVFYRNWKPELNLPTKESGQHSAGKNEEFVFLITKL